jgi:hypothetical protein
MSIIVISVFAAGDRRSSHREASHEEKAMNARARTKQQSKQTVPTAATGLGEPVRIRQLERSVCLTGRERPG